jgi:hypothetical protein
MPASPGPFPRRARGKRFSFFGLAPRPGSKPERKRRRFFDRKSLPSRQKPGQDIISTALFLPKPFPKSGIRPAMALQQCLKSWQSFT